MILVKYHMPLLTEHQDNGRCSYSFLSQNVYKEVLFIVKSLPAIKIPFFKAKLYTVNDDLCVMVLDKWLCLYFSFFPPNLFRLLNTQWFIFLKI